MNFCKGCIHYPCPDCEPDTDILDCDYKKIDRGIID